MTLKKSPDAKVEPKPVVKEERLGPTEVATLIGRRYQYTRDLMLSGAFGQPKYDSKSPKGKLTITRAQVIAYQAKLESPVVPKPVV